jgi:hypothetical protein
MYLLAYVSSSEVNCVYESLPWRNVSGCSRQRRYCIGIGDRSLRPFRYSGRGTDKNKSCPRSLANISMLPALKARLPFLRAERMRSGPSVALALGWSECSCIQGSRPRDSRPKAAISLPNQEREDRGAGTSFNAGQLSLVLFIFKSPIITLAYLCIPGLG